jgi:biotin synthase
MEIHDLMRKSQDGEILSHSELVYLLGLSPDSSESYLVMAEANRISKDLSLGQAEVHAQLALNLAPCLSNCLFCSFAQVNGVFTEEIRLEPEQAVAYAKQFESDGANAVLENYGKDKELKAITVMYKVAGYNPDAGDWF